MTISTLTSRVSYPGTGSAGPFAFPFRVQSSADLRVIKRSADGIETILTLATHYTVAGVAEVAGTVTLVSALAVGETLVIRRKPALTQPMSIRNQGSYFPATLEEEADRLVMQLQHLADQIERSPHLSESYDPSLYDLELAPGAAGQVLGWSGDGLANLTLSSGIVLDGVFNVLDYGLAGDGASDDGPELSTLANVTVPSTGGTVLVPPGTYRIATDVTIPVTTTLWMLAGAKFSIDAGKVLTIIGPFVGDLSQHFAGAGSVSFSIGSVDEVYPQWWPNCLPDGTTDCKAAYASAIAAAPEGGALHISPGKWNFDTQLTNPTNKKINITGDGLRSVLWMNVGDTVDGIVWGDMANSVNFGGGMRWKDFVIASDHSCKNGLVLINVLNSRFENIHVKAGAYTADRYAVWIQRAQGCYYNFIISGNITYPEPGSLMAWGGVKVEMPGGTLSVSEANVYDCIIEGGQTGLYVNAGVVGNGNDTVTGLYEGIDGYGIHYKGGNGVHIRDFYTEAGEYSEIVLEDHYCGVIGPGGNSHGVVGDPGGGDIKLINSVGTIVDGISCSVLNIDANCVSTQLGRILYTGQSVSQLVDLSTSTRQIAAPSYFANASTLVGSALPGPNLLVNGSGERWTTVATAPPGWSYQGVTPVFAREATIVKDGKYSIKVTTTATTQRVASTAPAATALPPYATIVVSGWLYIPTATGSDVGVDIWWDGGTTVRGAKLVTTRDVWTHVKFAFPARGINEDKAVFNLVFTVANAASVYYLDGWTMMASALGPPMSFVPSAIEFPVYTGREVWNWPNIVAGATSVHAFVCPGAALEMAAAAGAPVDLQGLMMSASVTAADTVTVVMFNPTAGAIDLASSTWTISATKVVDAP